LLLTLDDGPMTFSFRLLVVKLIGLGVAGVSLAERVVRRCANCRRVGGGRRRGQLTRRSHLFGHTQRKSAQK